MSDTSLVHEFEYFLAHQDELVREYRGKVVVIKGEEVIGCYDSLFDAVQTTSAEHELGTFLVQECEPGPQCYSATFYGHRVAFPAAS